jgi:hypothetical protein
MLELLLLLWECTFYLPSRRRLGGTPVPNNVDSRTKFRKQANAADNKAATIIIDSLINYEAVKVYPQ